MKLFITIAIFFILNTPIFSQENADSLRNAFTPEKKTARILVNKTIQFNTKDSINPDFEITAGKDLVFEYEFRSKEYLQISDDEFVERIIFNVNPKGNDFYYNLKNIKNAHLLYTQSCFSMEAGNYVIKIGSINGRKINKTTWNVQINFSYIARNTHNLVNKKFNIKYKIAPKNDH